MTPDQALAHLKAMSDLAPAGMQAHVTSVQAVQVLGEVIASPAPKGVVLPDAPAPNRATRRAAKGTGAKAKAAPA